MKKAITITFILLIFSLPAFAQNTQNAAEDQGEFIQEQTRQMTQYGVPQESATKMLQAMVHNNYQTQNMQQAAKAVMQAAQEGLPTKPIMSKAMEGMAKKASEENVIAAMNTVRERHSYVHKVTGSLPNSNVNKELTRAIADSLAAGMKTNDMDEIVGQLRNRTQQQTQKTAEELCLQTMQTVRTMAQMGAQSPDVSKALQHALQNNFSATEMKQMRRSIYSHANNEPPVQAAYQYAGEIGKGLNKNDDMGGGAGNQNGDTDGGGSGNGSGDGAGGEGSGSGNNGSGSVGGSGGSDGSGSNGGSGSSGGSGGSSGSDSSSNGSGSSSGSSGNGGSGGSGGSGGGSK